MNVKEVLFYQFSACHDQNGWFVPVRNALEGLTVEQAAWKPNDDVNCIWETLSHLAYYNGAYLQRFKGIEFEYDVSDNDETFSTGEYTEDDWQADVERFDAVMSEWRSLLEAAHESKFFEPVPTRTDRKWADVIADINTHNAYHAGQVLMLRKLQGSWEQGRGVS